ncbi:gamma carbonic anhydrase family protein [Marinisporobacter balticus]|uniref:Carbonic anhydrase/acetyltransferase-like protein (Isoleucine patch superfamily) n=1 Tax=Marinisporobacter balticus TaxID=2018667 RepID=A0A4R2L769_9FIRM|nr:gamma carbonic anhydrase family protein [Marinisporobacter balticus]TCO79846.1 carbonic anhydrase/acetyltransferase-like protein (isoleucine patch superfamily) [Marinisporobacter balticus]
MIIAYEEIMPEIHPSCYVAENATIIGKVKLKENVNVWYGTVIRGDDNYITIGENTNIQDNCTVHIAKDFPTIIGDNVTIGHNAIVHACKVGNNVLVGMGAIILNGAEIGENVIIAAGSIVPPGKKIPSNTLVMGSPAKVVRELTEEDRKKLKKSAINYVALANKHRNK